jgi:hypothetical protein
MAQARRKKASGRRPPEKEALRAARERMLDKTLEDSFPASDPPSSLPNPAGEAETPARD